MNLASHIFYGLFNDSDTSISVYVILYNLLSNAICFSNQVIQFSRMFRQNLRMLRQNLRMFRQNLRMLRQNLRMFRLGNFYVLDVYLDLVYPIY